jgi:hypothetical protein
VAGVITVRFPSGFSIQYNDLNHADIRDNGIYLGKKSDTGHYSVWAPKDCIIEHISPCRTYDAASESQTAVLKQQVDLLAKEIRSLKRAIAKGAKS